MRKKLFALSAAFLLSLPTFAQIERPKLVVGLVVDQMRWDYLYYYYDKFCEDGLRRLVDKGFSYENTLINYVPTITAVGHSSIYTGTVPALNGIVGNSFYIHGKKTYCCEDSTVESVGSKSREGQMSPRNLLASGIGDVLKIATDYKAKVIGVALKDRAAILPAGHGADAAYWWDKSAGHFVSSTYYMDKLPEWVNKVNKKIGEKPGTEVKTAVIGVSKTFQMAEAAIENEQMGQDSITDLLAVSVSSTDALGHVYGTRGKENYDVYMELDRQLSHFFKVLDEKVGKGNYLMFLSADHGAAHNHNLMKAHKIPSGGLELWNKLKPLNEQLQKDLQLPEPPIKDEDGGKIYLNDKYKNVDDEEYDVIVSYVCKALEQNENILYAVPFNKALTTSVPQPIREMIVNGYNKDRSGDIFFMPRAGWENVESSSEYKGTTHGEWNPYDAHIPFVLYGWHVNHGQTSTPAHIVDIAPTICAMLHIQMPNSCVGNSLSDYLSLSKCRQ